MDTATFKNKILSLSDKAYRLAKSILGDSDDASDVVQEMNVKLWEKRKMLSQVENIPAFVMRTVRNQCLDMIRRKRETGELSADIEYVELNPYQQLAAKDAITRIYDIINTLPETQRNVMHLRDVEEMEIAEIAYVMEMTENAVSVNLSRARLKVREQILKEQKL